MDKILLILFISVFYFGCNKETATSLQPVTNQFAGNWEVHTTGEAPGAATIIIKDNGLTDNGIVSTINDVEVIVYLNGVMEDDGTFRSVASVHKEYMLNNENLVLEGSGSYNGFFIDSIGTGSYLLNINNQVYSGTWTAVKF